MQSFPHLPSTFSAKLTFYSCSYCNQLYFPGESDSQRQRKVFDKTLSLHEHEHSNFSHHSGASKFCKLEIIIGHLFLMELSLLIHHNMTVVLFMGATSYYLMIVVI